MEPAQRQFWGQDAWGQLSGRSNKGHLLLRNEAISFFRSRGHISEQCSNVAVTLFALIRKKFASLSTQTLPFELRV